MSSSVSPAARARRSHVTKSFRSAACLASDGPARLRRHERAHSRAALGQALDLQLAVALVAAVRGSTDETKVQVRRISEPLQTAPELMAVLRRVGVLPGKVITVTTTPTKRRGKDEAS